MLSVTFNEFISNDITFIFMEIITKYNWWRRLALFYIIWYVSFWWSVLLYLSTITEGHSNLSQVLYSTYSIYYFFGFLVLLTASNPENSIFSLVDANFSWKQYFSIKVYIIYRRNLSIVGYWYSPVCSYFIEVGNMIKTVCTKYWTKTNTNRIVLFHHIITCKS